MFEKISPYAVLCAAIIAIIYAIIQFYSVKSKPEGTEKMQEISAKIRKGAMAYLKRQYKTVGIFAFPLHFFPADSFRDFLALSV